MCIELEGVMLSEISQRKTSYDLVDRWILGNKTEAHRGRKGKMKQDKTREGDKP